jgi:hypothetical protein
MGINAALYSGSKCYFFTGRQYWEIAATDANPALRHTADEKARSVS